MTARDEGQAAMPAATRAVIVAAGRGSRLGPLTADRPKCLVRLHGVSLLDRAIATLRRAGVNDIAATTGYLAEQIARPGITVFPNPSWETSGIFHSCTCARAWLEEGSTLIVYGDIFFSSETARRILGADGDVIVAYDPRGVELWQQRSDDPLSDLENFRIGTDGLIQHIGGRPTCLADVQGQYMGILGVSARGWSQLLEARDTFPVERARLIDMTSLLQRLIEKGQPVRGVPVDGPWGEIDTADDLALYESLYDVQALDSSREVVP